MVTTEEITSILSTVTDPEIPALSIVDMGIVRDVTIANEEITVTITPTYSGCPAMKVIEDDIIAALGNSGFSNVKIKLSYAHAWTSDWLSNEARQKLHEAGITAPPMIKDVLKSAPPEVQCPSCGSKSTTMVSEFGSTACKSYYYCNDCTTTFEYFKPL